MPYPGGKHGPGHYIGNGGIIPPPLVPDPVGAPLFWHSQTPVAFGLERIYTTADGSTFGFIQAPPSTSNPGSGDFVVSNLTTMVALSKNDPPTAAQERTFTTLDGADWFDVSGNAASIWNLGGSPSISELFFFRVSGVFAAFHKNTNDYFTSVDGAAWVSRQLNPWVTFNPEPNSYGSDGTLDFLITQSPNAIRSTTDGFTWTTVEPSVSANRFVFAGSNSGDKYWLFGNSGTSARVESSPTGLTGTWARDVPAETSLESLGLLSFNNSFDVAYSNNIRKFVLSFGNILSDGSASNRLAVSLDGTSWMNPGSVFIGNRVRYSPTLNEFVKTGGTSFSNPFLLRSGNGTTWAKFVYATFPTVGVNNSADKLLSF